MGAMDYSDVFRKMRSLVLLTWFILTVCLVLYILAGIGLYRLARERRIRAPWLAFIPLGNFWIMGKLAGEVRIARVRVPGMEILLPAAVLLLFSVRLLETLWINILAAVLFILLMAAAFYTLVRRERPGKEILYTLLAIVLPFMGPVLLLIMGAAARPQPSDSR